uniref:Uncharacterized protein n=1 Tax=Oryzias latipes TaxID=8090 RepID=A0A286P9U5_ORYLA|nr:hypothetical protein [Oryzias latipes]
MASEAIFQMFPEAGASDLTEGELRSVSEADQFLRKQYPMLHMNISGGEHPSIRSLCYEKERSKCLLCERLDKNTLDSIGVLEPQEVAPYLKSCHHAFTRKQINLHLAHCARDDENVAGVLRSMTLDLISGSYSLASQASVRVMNRVRTHMGRLFLVPDQAVAKVHNDAVKQFIGLAATCQSLMKRKQTDADKGNGDPAHPLL